MPVSINSAAIIITGIKNLAGMISDHTMSIQMSVGTHTALRRVAGLIVDAYDEYVTNDSAGIDPLPNGVAVELDNGLKPVLFSRSIMNRLANGTLANRFVDAFVWWVNGGHYNPIYMFNQLFSVKREADDLGIGSGEIVSSIDYYTSINTKPLKPAADAVVAVANTQRFIHDLSTAFIWENWFYQKTTTTTDPNTGEVTTVTEIVDGDDTDLANQIDDMKVGDLFDMFGTFLIVSTVITALRPFPKLIARIVEKVFGVVYESVPDKILEELTSEDDDQTIEAKIDSLDDAMRAINAVAALRNRFG